MKHIIQGSTWLILLFFQGVNCDSGQNGLSNSKSNHRIEYSNDNDLHDSICIPNAEMAIEKAKSELIRSYGSDVSKNNFSVELITDTSWLIISLDSSVKPKSDVKNFSFGGCYSIELRKSDCKILKIYANK